MTASEIVEAKLAPPLEPPPREYVWEQQNISITSPERDRFHALADRYGWSLRETFNLALDVLEATLTEARGDDV